MNILSHIVYNGYYCFCRQVLPIRRTVNVTVKKIIEQFMSLIEEKVFFLGKNVYNKFRKRRYYSKYNYYEKYFQYLWSS